MTRFSKSDVTVDGVRVQVLEAGQGRPLVYFHGAGAGRGFDELLPLAEGRHLIVPIHPGFGASDDDPRIDTVLDYVVHYAALFDLLKLEAPVDLVGHSLGGWIAAELAARNTSRLASLTLVAAAGIHVKGIAQVDSFLQNDEQRVRAFFHDPKRAEEMLKHLARPELEDINLKNRTTTAKLIWQPRGYDPHLHKWLHRIDVPTLLVWGDDDRLFPKDYAFAYQRLIPGSKVTIIPECGHLPQAEQRQAFVAALEGFFDTMKVAA